ncbi:unnamed protein product [Allacma fusca]|uniref:Uncharacterized protein n=1 Tax=Allacma fusca TaxID=39272 RepID=A0A8J2L039_9HEXA|nr:unnamed protein product [Allacma fusca]
MGNCLRYFPGVKPESDGECKSGMLALLLDLQQDVKANRKSLKLLDKIASDSHLIKVAVNAQIKKVEALEKKVESVETRLDAEIVHLKNELCQQKGAA